MDSVIQPGMTDYQKELQLHDYLVNHCTYSFGSADNDNEYRAYGALVEGQAVCNGYAESMALLLSCAGVNNQVVTGWGDNDLHAWNLVEIDGDWYHLDATWDDPVGDEEVLSHAYFNVTDEIMEQRHVWQEEDYVSCDSMAANYFVQSQSYYTDYDSFTAGMSVTAALDEDGWIECGIVGYDQDTYNLQFLYEVNGINSIRYAADGNEAFTVLTLYLNR
jgi:transglutaminase/protease-like cytokinesis protein 3